MGSFLQYSSPTAMKLRHSFGCNAQLYVIKITLLEYSILLYVNEIEMQKLTCNMENEYSQYEAW